jgi:hypothetical protein
MIQDGSRTCVTLLTIITASERLKDLRCNYYKDQDHISSKDEINKYCTSITQEIILKIIVIHICGRKVYQFAINAAKG